MKPHCQKCFHEKKVYLNDIVNYTPVQKPNTELEILRSSTQSILDLKNKSSENYNILQSYKRK